MKIGVIGLGYVGLPLAIAFSKHYNVVGYDINKKTVSELKKGFTFIEGIKKKDLSKKNLFFTSNPVNLKKCGFIIVAVPTPITKNKFPDLSFLRSASKTIGENLKKNSLIVFESTVYPGTTEEVCIPIIEKFSGFKAGKEFFVGYSPERINPGDEMHSLERVVKIVSGQDKKTAKKIAGFYKKIVKTGVFIVSDIKTAEAAKVIENIQRDVNIGLVNEFSLLFEKMGLDTKNILSAAKTKWNFLPFHPGLVGGHCISVDPYYLTYIAERHGYRPELILAGRRINDFMPVNVALKTVKALALAEKKIRNSSVLIFGATFKENVSDYRNSGVKKIISELKKWKIKVECVDPHISLPKLFGVKLYQKIPQKKYDAIVFAVPHKAFKGITLKKLGLLMKGKPVLIDVRWFFSKKQAEKQGFVYDSL